MKHFLFICLLATSVFTSCGKNINKSQVETTDTSSNVTIHVIRADFAKILPNHANIITDLTKTLTVDQLKVLDSIWQKFYTATKKGIATMILDSGRISEKDYNDFAQTIYNRWIPPEKADAIYIVISPSLKRARLFAGDSLKQFLSNKDLEVIMSNITRSIYRDDLYMTIKNVQIEIIDKIKQNGG